MVTLVIWCHSTRMNTLGALIMYWHVYSMVDPRRPPFALSPACRVVDIRRVERPTDALRSPPWATSPPSDSRDDVIAACSDLRHFPCLSSEYGAKAAAPAAPSGVDTAELERR